MPDGKKAILSLLYKEARERKRKEDPKAFFSLLFSLFSIESPCLSNSRSLIKNRLLCTPQFRETFRAAQGIYFSAAVSHQITAL